MTIENYPQRIDMHRISDRLFSQYPKTTNPQDLEMYDVVAFEHPHGYLVIAVYFDCDNDTLTFHNLSLPVKDVKRFYILASPLRDRDLDFRN